MSLYFLFLAWVLRDISAYHIRLFISWLQLPNLLKVSLSKRVGSLGYFCPSLSSSFNITAVRTFYCQIIAHHRIAFNNLGLWRRQPHWLKVTPQTYSGFLRQRDVWGQFFSLFLGWESCVMWPRACPQPWQDVLQLFMWPRVSRS